MDRRYFFSQASTLISRNSLEEMPQQQTSSTPVVRPVNDLSKYEGVFEKQQIYHLLRRATFGPNQYDVLLAEELGLDKTLDRLFDTDINPDLPPINYIDTGDAQWTTGLGGNTNIDTRLRSLRAWWIDNMIYRPLSIKEKVSLFWHNHLVTGAKDIKDGRFSYEYLKLIRENSLGNVKQLVLKMTTNPAMLVYLSGDDNVKGSPNENYARELMELFTLGRTKSDGRENYTEEDIIEIARALTGWTVNKNPQTGSLEGFAVFKNNLHDTAPKNLSSHFNNKLIHRTNPAEYRMETQDVIDAIFERGDTAIFICRELYKWFVYYEVDADTERDIIVPLANVLMANNYELKPVLRVLLSSRHFFDNAGMGSMIRNPLDYVIGTIRQSETFDQKPTKQLSYMARYDFADRIGTYAASMQMDLLNPPNVAGWTAYYQSPAFYQGWISFASYILRNEFILKFINQGIPYQLAPNIGNTGTATINHKVLIIESAGTGVTDVNEVLNALIRKFLPLNISQKQIDYLKDVLMNKIPDAEWANEWALYIADKNPAMVKRVKALLYELMSMAEYQLS